MQWCTITKNNNLLQLRCAEKAPPCSTTFRLVLDAKQWCYYFCVAPTDRAIALSTRLYWWMDQTEISKYYFSHIHAKLDQIACSTHMHLQEHCIQYYQNNSPSKCSMWPQSSKSNTCIGYICTIKGRIKPMDSSHWSVLYHLRALECALQRGNQRWGRCYKRYKTDPNRIRKGI